MNHIEIILTCVGAVLFLMMIVVFVRLLKNEIRPSAGSAAVSGTLALLWLVPFFLRLFTGRFSAESDLKYLPLFCIWLAIAVAEVIKLHKSGK